MSFWHNVEVLVDFWNIRKLVAGGNFVKEKLEKYYYSQGKLTLDVF